MIQAQILPECKSCHGFGLESKIWFVINRTLQIGLPGVEFSRFLQILVFNQDIEFS
jgi:hypothetical protein